MSEGKTNWDTLYDNLSLPRYKRESRINDQEIIELKAFGEELAERQGYQIQEFSQAGFKIRLLSFFQKHGTATQQQIFKHFTPQGAAESTIRNNLKSYEKFLQKSGRGSSATYQYLGEPWPF